MVDRDIICNRISYIEDNIRQLNELAKLPEAEFLSRFYKEGISDIQAFVKAIVAYMDENS
ncbi:hypothetical protein TcarDRAFT_2641 [Thermosinus carboxydivorans Nor1]|uniref:Uncharacterized protein n=1 Tax=Thermosinus carboxydivorans Nor1 TaxID=401526 RepID=A1HMA7_9FIRM|nr:hypothetical protein [Thermosinus carboxydivorans]EAX48952.1 hypothetical protein TcarDRAFT_2641 [Thermosinus carboxydivorans Nor1]